MLPLDYSAKTYGILKKLSDFTWKEFTDTMENLHFCLLEKVMRDEIDNQGM